MLGISIYKKIPKTGYLCPDCDAKIKKGKVKRNGRNNATIA